MSEHVSVDTFIRAETDRYLATFVAEGGGGSFHHSRTLPDIDHQTVVRMNRDTLYSALVLDLDAGDATITLPASEGRFMSLQVIDQDHYVITEEYGEGAYTYTRDQVPTRYVAVLVRVLVDENDPSDVAKVHDLQDKMTVTQGGVGHYEFGDWDQKSLGEIRAHLIALGHTLSDFRHAFGTRENVDPIHHLIGTAAGWGGNPDSDAVYVPINVPQNDGSTPYILEVPSDVPVDGFWSLSVYGGDGYFVKNDAGRYSINNITAVKQADGGIVVRFGGDPLADNYLPIPADWNCTVRLYRPRPEVVDGTWAFPRPQLAN